MFLHNSGRSAIDEGSVGKLRFDRAQFPFEPSNLLVETIAFGGFIASRHFKVEFAQRGHRHRNASLRLIFGFELQFFSIEKAGNGGQFLFLEFSSRPEDETRLFV